MSDDSREENVYMAKLAEQAERYDEVCADPTFSPPALARLTVASGARKLTCGFPAGKARSQRWPNLPVRFCFTAMLP